MDIDIGFQRIDPVVFNAWVAEPRLLSTELSYYGHTYYLTYVLSVSTSVSYVLNASEVHHHHRKPGVSPIRYLRLFYFTVCYSYLLLDLSSATPEVCPLH